MTRSGLTPDLIFAISPSNAHMGVVLARKTMRALGQQRVIDHL